MTSVFGSLRQPYALDQLPESSLAFLVTFWVVKATMTIVALYVRMITVVVELEGAELI